MSRVLLTLVGCLLVVMPWTEYFCSFDHFLRGGPDMELGLLAVLTVLCLVLVLFQAGRTLLASLLALLQWFAAMSRSVKGITDNAVHVRLKRRTSPPYCAYACTGAFILPLQI